MNKQMKTLSATAAVLLACGLSIPANADNTAQDDIGSSYPVGPQAAPRQATELIQLAGPTSAAVKQANNPEIQRAEGTDLFSWQAIQRDSQNYGD